MPDKMPDRKGKLSNINLPYLATILSDTWKTMLQLYQTKYFTKNHAKIQADLSVCCCTSVGEHQVYHFTIISDIYYILF